jgi:hypothetical protein
LKKWCEHYKNLWHDPLNKTINRDKNIEAEEVDQITIGELKLALEKTENQKTTGLDGINSELIKYGGESLELRFTNLLNECWQRCEIPDDWEKARIISLFKKGERLSCENYRGLSLLNTSYKVYSKILTNRLKVIADKLFLEEQSGFRQGRSCNLTKIRK